MDEEIVDKELFFVRHACSWGNVENTGGAPEFNKDDPPLTPAGHEQARLLSGRFEKGGLDAIFSSPFLRTVCTALPTAEKLGLNIGLVPQLMETDTKICGTDEKTLSALSDRIILPYPAAVPPPDTDEVRRARAEYSIKYILGKCPDAKRIMIVSHGTFLRYVYEYVLGIENRDTFRWSNDNCAVTRIILYKNRTPKLKSQNDRVHLYHSEKDYFTFKGETKNG